VTHLVAFHSALVIHWVTASAYASDGLKLQKLETFGGIHQSDYSTVSGISTFVYGEQLSLTLPIPEPIGFRFDGLVGRFTEGVWVGEAAGHLYANTSRYLMGISYGRIQLQGGLRSNLFAMNAAIYEDTLMTVSWNVGYESKNFGDGLYFSELFLRLYVAPRWLLVPGVSYAQSEFKQTRADTMVRGEFLAFSGAAVSGTVYVQYGGNLFTKASVGFVLYFDNMGFRDRDMKSGPTNARFK
jgi:hypothetical protein